MAEARWPWPGVGLAAGHDREGSRIDEVARAGFAFVELGTVTPAPESGHNPGAQALRHALARARDEGRLASCAAGVSIGAQFASSRSQLAGDWRHAARAVRDVADFLVVNLSAPYYRPLLQDPWLATSLQRLAEDLAGDKPLLLKLPCGDPQLPRCDWLDALAGWGWRGLVVSQAATGLDAACQDLARLRARLPQMVLISVGGIRDPGELQRRWQAGADAAEILTAYVEGGAAARALPGAKRPRPTR